MQSNADDQNQAINELNYSLRRNYHLTQIELHDLEVTLTFVQKSNCDRQVHEIILKALNAATQLEPIFKELKAQGLYGMMRKIINIFSVVYLILNGRNESSSQLKHKSLFPKDLQLIEGLQSSLNVASEQPVEVAPQSAHESPHRTGGITLLRESYTRYMDKKADLIKAVPQSSFNAALDEEAIKKSFQLREIEQRMQEMLEVSAKLQNTLGNSQFQEKLKEIYQSFQESQAKAVQFLKMTESTQMLSILEVSTDFDSLVSAQLVEKKFQLSIFTERMNNVNARIKLLINHHRNELLVKDAQIEATKQEIIRVMKGPNKVDQSVQTQILLVFSEKEALMVKVGNLEEIIKNKTEFAQKERERMVQQCFLTTQELVVLRERNNVLKDEILTLKRQVVTANIKITELKEIPKKNREETFNKQIKPHKVGGTPKAQTTQESFLGENSREKPSPIPRRPSQLSKRINRSSFSAYNGENPPSSPKPQPFYRQRSSIQVPQIGSFSHKEGVLPKTVLKKADRFENEKLNLNRESIIFGKQNEMTQHQVTEQRSSSQNLSQNEKEPTKVPIILAKQRHKSTLVKTNNQVQGSLHSPLAADSDLSQISKDHEDYDSQRTETGRNMKRKSSHLPSLDRMAFSNDSGVRTGQSKQSPARRSKINISNSPQQPRQLNHRNSKSSSIEFSNLDKANNRLKKSPVSIRKSVFRRESRFQLTENPNRVAKSHFKPTQQSKEEVIPQDQTQLQESKRDTDEEELLIDRDNENGGIDENNIRISGLDTDANIGCGFLQSNQKLTSVTQACRNTTSAEIVQRLLLNSQLAICENFKNEAESVFSHQQHAQILQNQSKGINRTEAPAAWSTYDPDLTLPKNPNYKTSMAGSMVSSPTASPNQLLSEDSILKFPSISSSSNQNMSQSMLSTEKVLEEEAIQLAIECNNAQVFTIRLKQLHQSRCGAVCSHLQRYINNFHRFKSKRTALKVSVCKM